MNSEITPTTAAFRAPLTSRLEIRATLCSGDYLRIGVKHEKIFPHGSNGNVDGDL
jgi:hypothetical protein